VFELNEDAEVKVIKNIKGRSAVIIDNFYKNPDKVRELAITLKYTKHPIFPGVRGVLATPELKEKLYDTYLNLCSDTDNWSSTLWYNLPKFNVELFNEHWDTHEFLVNLLNDFTLKSNPRGIIPHQDYWKSDPHHQGCPEYQFGSVIYLNFPDECAGGTNLYSYNGEMSISEDLQPEWKEGIDEIETDIAKFKYIKSKVDGNNQYAVEFEAEMVYNRMVLYQSDVLHSHNVTLGMFKNTNRINQVFFM